MDRQAKIREIIRTVTRQEVNIDSEASLFDSDLLDSFALPELVSGLEREFGISIPDSDLDPRRFNSISSIDRYLKKRG
jgi:acyl carrier protein